MGWGFFIIFFLRDFPGVPVVKNLPCNAEDTGLISSPGRSIYLRETKPVHHSY